MVRGEVTLSDVVALSGVAFGTSGARGLVSQFTDQVCHSYITAFWRALGHGSEVVLGHDLRPSSPQISAACAAAFTAMGITVRYVGSLPTPAVASYARDLGAPGIIVTGSHIPFDRNGIKFYRVEGEITKSDELAMMRVKMENQQSETDFFLPDPEYAAERAYIQRYVDFLGFGSLSGQKVAIYEHSSVARDILHKILECLGAEVISLGRTDTFVPIDTEAVRPEDQTKAIGWAGEHSFDAILSTDGDGDRPLIGDERGHWLRGDIVGILCAQFLSADAVVTPVSSNTAVETCGKFKQVARTRIGSPYVIEMMETVKRQGEPGAFEGSARHPIVVGYEANGGFLLGTDVEYGGRQLKALPTRDAILPMLALLSLMKERNCKLSELVGTLPERYTFSERLQDFPTQKSKELLSKLQGDRQFIKDVMVDDRRDDISEIDLMDGLRVTFLSGNIVHLRPSGNAPELRCYAEANSEQDARRLCINCLRRVSTLMVGL